MLSLGAIALTAPWMLLGLAALPLIWWLLRITPPLPRRVRFPPVRILLGLRGEEETPAATPLWLALLRLLLGALAVLALAHPLLHPGADLSGEGPVMLVIDDGWAAAPNWSLRQQTALTLVERAKRRQRPVLVLTTAPPAAGGPIQSSGLLQAAEVEPIIRALQPKPWSTDRAAAAAAARQLPFQGQPTVYWLSDGIDSPERSELDAALAALGPLQLLQQAVGQRAMALLPPVLTRQGFAATVLRPGGEGSGALGTAAISVRAIGERGRVLGQATAQFTGNEDRAVAQIPLPGELRNRALRLELAGAGSAAASILLDERWRRRPVGLVSGGGVEERSQPLLSNLYYLERALQPYAELRLGEITALLQRPLAVLVLADIGRLSGAQQQRLT
ncbi:MAG: BatA domain-containing protein, partial [Alphaproteobacteria bacterium]|nr:BatA domain-containing protein [Alphaproteobacteria bacterium]